MEKQEKLTKAACKCGNKEVQDFSGYGASSDYVVHLYCRNCGCHLYRDKHYTAKAWEKYVES